VPANKFVGPLCVHVYMFYVCAPVIRGARACVAIVWAPKIDAPHARPSLARDLMRGCAVAAPRNNFACFFPLKYTQQVVIFGYAATNHAYFVSADLSFFDI
jgi:hypothetical protein